MKFRPCIDLHQGKVKQIVGSSLSSDQSELVTNFEAEHPPKWFAELYKKDGLAGGHVIQLGGGNLEAAKEALAAYPGGMQIGGGVNEENAKGWLDAGAAQVIVTSYVFQGGKVQVERLKSLSRTIGKDRLVLDLSCRKKDGRYYVVTDLWQKFTEVEVTPQNLDLFKEYADEFLIHAVDVEGKGLGVDSELIGLMGDWAGLAMTYAGGVHSAEDIEIVKSAGRGALDFTVGSALDIFGGKGLKYEELARMNQEGF